jgi:hypothetical protein
MLKKAFDALKVGDRVAVTGTQDGKQFSFEVGTIVDSPYVSAFERLVRFDTWSDGHGVGEHEWSFSDDNRRRFAITPFVEVTKVVLDPKPEPKPRKRPHGAQEYKGNGKHAWETVTAETKRLRVPGGWLYGEYSRRIDRIINSTFVPVPQAVGYAV